VLPTAAGYASEAILPLGPRFLTFVDFQVTPGGSGLTAMVCVASRSDVREVPVFSTGRKWRLHPVFPWFR
jgi:hypothetical protein